MSVRELLREFESLTTSSTPLVAAWARRHPVLAGCVELRDVLTAVRPDPDAVLGALLQETADGCMVAGRVVLQALLPKMITMAGRDAEPGVLDDYVCALWLRIIDYPLDRRPQRIAANLVLDTLKTVRAERGAQLVLLDRAQIHALPWLRGEPTRRPDPHTLLRAAMDRGLVDPHTHNVLASVYAEGLSSAETAKRFGVTPNAIQRRCRRGIRAIAARAHELADAG